MASGGGGGGGRDCRVIVSPGTLREPRTPTRRPVAALIYGSVSVGRTDGQVGTADCRSERSETAARIDLRAAWSSQRQFIEMTCIRTHSSCGGGGVDSHFINIWRVRLGASYDSVRLADHKTRRTVTATGRGQENRSMSIDRRPAQYCMYVYSKMYRLKATRISGTMDH